MSEPLTTESDQRENVAETEPDSDADKPKALRLSRLSVQTLVRKVPREEER